MIRQKKRRRLLNPGPVTLSDRVRSALMGPDMCHREREFADVMSDVRRRLEHVYPQAAEQYSAVLLTGSGTAAVEAMIGSLVPRDGRALVVANGVYGERMIRMLRMQEKAVDVICSEWTAPLDLGAIRRRLESSDAYSHVVTVHHETTTGRLNDLDALGELCQRHHVPLLLDAVSSFGGERIDFARWNLEACASTANKCLHGVPGMSFVLVRKETLEQGSTAATSLYLDLHSNYQSQSQSTPLFTPAVQTLCALQEALAELEDHGGWQARRSNYRDRSSHIRDALKRQGLQLLLADPLAYSSVLTSFRLPSLATFEQLSEHLKQSGFVIYPGQQSLREIIFRVSVMGELFAEDLNELLDCLSQFLSQKTEVPLE